MPDPAAPRPAAPQRRRRQAVLVLVGAAVGAAGVGLARAVRAPEAVDGHGPARTAAEPVADFVVAAGDSTYWVTRAADGSGDGTLHVRASPLFLARWGGRLSEVYVADDERAFEDGAWFAAQRVYRRDLLTGDSALVFADPTVPRLAARYAAAHPDVRVLDPDESPPAPDDEEGAGDDHAPPPAAETAVALAAAHGPYVSLEQRTSGAGDVEPPGGAPAGGDVQVRRVVDLRSGREVTLAELFGRQPATWLAGAGQRALRAAVARLAPLARGEARAATRATDSTAPDRADAARRAHAALATLRFDPANFGLADSAGAPAVVFVALGRDADGTPVTLPLAPIAVPGAAPAWWRADVAPTLLLAPGDRRGARPGAPTPARGVRWRPARGTYEVRLRPAAGGAAALELVARAPSGQSEGAGAAVRAWPLARVPAGPAQLFAIDDAATRRALRRAFDESAFYDDATTSVAWRPPAAASGRRARAGAPAL